MRKPCALSQDVRARICIDVEKRRLPAGSGNGSVLPTAERTMKWSVRLGRLFGIDVFIHLTFVLLLAWVGFAHYQRDQSLHAALAGVGFVVAVFAIVTLHELGHALAARRYGIATRDITLLPIGGVARLERIPEKPQQELVVALAGPAVNVAFAVVFLAVALALRLPLVPDTTEETLAIPFISRLFWVNVTLAVFNLLPAFPMDGGRALRAVLALSGDYVRATQSAARIGQAMAFVLGGFGLLYNPLLILIALFVWMGAASEAGAVSARAAVHGLPVHAAMIREFRTLRTYDTLMNAADVLVAGTQVDFPVLDEHDRLVGVLTRSDLIEGLARGAPHDPVAPAMSTTFETADPYDLLENATTRLESCECRAMPVVHLGKVVGLLTMENVGELLLVRGALSKPREGGGLGAPRATAKVVRPETLSSGSAGR